MLDARDDERSPTACASCACTGIDRDAWKRYRRRPVRRLRVVEPGYKYNLSTCTPASALGQLQQARRAPRAARERRPRSTTRRLAELEGVEPLGRRAGARARATPGTSTSCASTASAPAADRDAYATALTGEGIGTGLHFLPVHTLTYYRERLGPISLPVAEGAAGQVLSLPLSPAHALGGHPTTSCAPCAGCASARV